MLWLENRWYQAAWLHELATTPLLTSIGWGPERWNRALRLSWVRFQRPGAVRAQSPRRNHQRHASTRQPRRLSYCVINASFIGIDWHHLRVDRADLNEHAEHVGDTEYA